VFICASCRNRQFFNLPPWENCKDCAYVRATLTDKVKLGTIAEEAARKQSRVIAEAHARAEQIIAEIKKIRARHAKEAKAQAADEEANRRAIKSYPLNVWGFDRETYEVFSSCDLLSEYKDKAMCAIELEEILLDEWDERIYNSSSIFPVFQNNVRE